MTDIVDPLTRSRMMSCIRSGNTKPELILRKILHKTGFRYRLHDSGIPGKPDLVFPRYHAVLFVHGCFWHGHVCPFFRLPGTRTEFWKNKIQKNRERDMRVRNLLLEKGWRVATVWECTFRSKPKSFIENRMKQMIDWIKSDSREIEISGGA